MIQDFQLGLLVATASVLLLLVLVAGGVGLALHGWLRRHERGSLSWHRLGFEVKAERAQQRVQSEGAQ